MNRLETRLDGLVLLEPKVFGDDRGFFSETYRENVWAEHGISDRFVQDNHSRSVRGTLRGMHFQAEPGQAKLIRCARGRILDVVVDLRRGPGTFGEYETVELDDQSMRQLYIPIGFAHGFCVLSDEADVVYKCSSYYDGATESQIAYDDPDLALPWPEDVELIVSERDTGAPRLADVAADLPF